jgi:hypothetical protein
MLLILIISLLSVLKSQDEKCDDGFIYDAWQEDHCVVCCCNCFYFFKV